MSSKIILSICIPTYNRAEYLDKNLQSIMEQIKDTDEVEVIVSDDTSTDNTEQIVNKYTATNKVIYKRNTTNIGADSNIIQVLALGSGNYVKLMNDRTFVSEGGIAILLKTIKENEAGKPVLFFSNGNSLQKNAVSCYCNDFNQFMGIASFYTTWIGAVGFWRDDFEKLKQNFTFITKHFYHTELLFENFRLKDKSYVCLDKIIEHNEVQNQLIHYNFFEVFLNEYLNDLLVHMIKTNLLSERAYNIEKKRMFADFVYPRYKQFKIKKNHNFNIQTKGMERIIFNSYKNTIYFYGYLIYMPFYLGVFYLKKLVGLKK